MMRMRMMLMLMGMIWNKCSKNLTDYLLEIQRSRVSFLDDNSCEASPVMKNDATADPHHMDSLIIQMTLGIMMRLQSNQCNPYFIYMAFNIMQTSPQSRYFNNYCIHLLIVDLLLLQWLITHDQHPGFDVYLVPSVVELCAQN
ncbi:unnamed protein product [Allacma fusca]|uniref:Uncharacterized protein n=1 Tax=Allacma fusca TaxID=39272 RepID=A0A8J2PUN8_9HEXA|nr:unnamed protein product [Allacma fusca]